jgi:pimeloyl-ACP methyl ester carboxylesterase
VIRHTTFTHRGHKTAATIHGPDAGTPVVFLHGAGQTRYSWGNATASLARAGFCTWSLDLRGHGDSDWSPDGDYRLETFADDLRNVLADIGRPAAVVGASLGGISALIAAGETPRVPILSLTLVDITSRASQKGVEHIVGFMEGTLGGFDSLEDAADAVAKYLPHRKRPKDLAGLGKNLRRRADGRYYWHWDPRIHQRPQDLDMDAFDRRLEEAARRVEAPTLILRGGRSELVTPEGARAFVSLFRHGELAEIDDAHHMVAGDQNDPFSGALVAFVARHARQSRHAT